MLVVQLDFVQYVGQHERKPCMLQGIGPNLVVELCEAADVDPELLPREMEEAEWAALFSEWRAWVRSVTLGRFRPAMDPATGRISVLGSGSQKAGSVHALVDAALCGSQVWIQPELTLYYLTVMCGPSVLGTFDLVIGVVVSQQGLLGRPSRADNKRGQYPGRMHAGHVSRAVGAFSCLSRTVLI